MMTWKTFSAASGEAGMSYNQFYKHPPTRETMAEHMLYELDRLRLYGKEPDEILVNLVDWDAFRISKLNGLVEPYRTAAQFDPLVMWNLPVRHDASISPGGFMFRAAGKALN